MNMVQNKAELFRRLPSVDELLRLESVRELAEREGLAAVTEAARAVVTRLREAIASGEFDEHRLELALGGVGEAVSREVDSALAYSLRAVINATGVVLHTNLGRAPLAETAVEHIRETATQFSNLEFDMQSGERGKRDAHVQRLFARLLGNAAETSTVVVNNCAAAVLIALNTLAEGGEVIVSRGELVEIGGSFRVPDVMAKSGGVLREVGTTNRTRIGDYEGAITEKTRLLLRVHRSNFAMVGFTEQPSLEELVALGRKRNIPVMEDLGNGAMFDLRMLGVAGESGVAESLRAGVDVITYSGDKLLGGPQAGMISGRAELVARIRANPLFRALRVDKLTYAALEATLLAYLRGRQDEIPALRMMRTSVEELRARAVAMMKSVGGALRGEMVECESVIGGGTTPGAVLPSVALALTHAAHSADELQRALRNGEPAIIARVEDRRTLLDLRTIFPKQDEAVSAALRGLRN